MVNLYCLSVWKEKSLQQLGDSLYFENGFVHPFLVFLFGGLFFLLCGCLGIFFCLHVSLFCSSQYGTVGCLHQKSRYLYHRPDFRDLYIL